MLWGVHPRGNFLEHGQRSVQGGQSFALKLIHSHGSCISRFTSSGFACAGDGSGSFKSCLGLGRNRKSLALIFGRGGFRVWGVKANYIHARRQCLCQNISRSRQNLMRCDALLREVIIAALCSLWVLWLSSESTVLCLPKCRI